MPKTNQEIADLLKEISLYLQMDDVAFKPQAYERAALNLEVFDENIEDVYRKDGISGLEKIPGVGKGIAEKIVEYLKTGTINEYEKLKRKTPVEITELKAVEGLGPKNIKKLYKKLSIRNLKELEKAAEAHKISQLEGFGEKSEEKILKGIEFLRRSSGRFVLGFTMPFIKKIEERLSNLKEVEKVVIAGSVRRRKETIGDIDILAISKKPEPVMDFFVKMPEVINIYAKGKTKSAIKMQNGLDVDLRIVPKESFGAALNYFTGSKEHNIALREIAIKKGYKLNEYGLFKGKKQIAKDNEESVYKLLGLDYITPELRENSGEIEAARNHKLPKIIGYDDIWGDLHCHSDWDGGANSIEEMAEAAIKMGYQYVGIADHTKFLRIERGLDERQLEKRNQKIDKINSKLKIPAYAEASAGRQNSKFRVLKGCEANIMTDGSIDIADEALAKLDYVIAGVHSQMKMSRAQMTERIVKAMQNPHVDIISHPTGRILQRRDEYEIDFDKILKAAKVTGTILEINAYPVRLDLNDINIRKAKEAGVKMVINTDSHHQDQLNFMEYGIAQARRGWATKNDIVNAWPVEKFLSFLK